MNEENDKHVELKIPLTNDRVCSLILPKYFNSNDLEELIQWVTFVKGRKIIHEQKYDKIDKLLDKHAEEYNIKNKQ